MTGAFEVPAAEWDELVRALGVTDVYYSRGYVDASAALVNGTSAYLCHADQGGAVVFPCVLREDPVDVITPYGYGGPLAAGSDPPLAAFTARYNDWCRSRGVVSTFALYHPLARNAQSAQATGFHTNDLAGTVAWDLSGVDLLAGMHAHHRRAVRRAAGQGLIATVDPDPADLDGFIDLYEQTMRRAGADPFYLFDAEYWNGLVADVGLVRVDVRSADELCASVIGFGDGHWLHYHLGGNSEEGRKAGASTLALFELARWGQEEGCAVLHLGGGVGGRADSLLAFKQRFAPGGLVPATIGKAVNDADAYSRLTSSNLIDWDGFFPAYRAPR